jgi:DNA replication protein DnaC
VPPGHPDFGKAIPCQCVQKELVVNRISRLQRYSNLGSLTRFTFDNWIIKEDFSEISQAVRAFAENPVGWLVLAGPSGCGKTHLAAAVANERINRGYPAFFIVVPDLLDHLRATFSPTSEISYDELFEQVQNAPLLILDDLRTQGSTPWAQEKLFQFINHRYNYQIPTVITIGVPLDSLDERIATRISDSNLSQIYLLGEAKPSCLAHLGGLELDLLKRMTFDNFDFRRVNLSLEERSNLKQVYELCRHFAQSPEGWLILQGTNGCGKTHLAAAITNHLLSQERPVSFIPVPELLDHLRATFSPESKITYDELFETVKQAPLLILDDFGEHSGTPWAQEKLYQLVNYRYNARLPTVITTTYSLDEIEPRFSSRMADPQISTVFSIIAPDYRADRHPTRTTEPRASRRRTP